jgi:hypothetical protein
MPPRSRLTATVRGTRVLWVRMPSSALEERNRLLYGVRNQISAPYAAILRQSIVLAGCGALL